MSQEQKNIQSDKQGDDEIDLLKLAKTIWNGRKYLFIFIAAGTILGITLALLTPKVYTASTVMVPQMGKTGQSELSGLAALAGISLNTNANSSEMSPILYPKIVSSIPFKLELLNAPIKFSVIDQPISLLDYYTVYDKPTVLGIFKKYTVGLPGVLISLIKGKQKDTLVHKDTTNQPIYLSKNEYDAKKILDKVIVLDVNAKDGYLTLSVQMPEALAAAQVAQIAQELLQRYITAFKIKKAQADLDFIQGRYDAAKAEAEKYQINVAINTDRFKNFTSNVPQVENARIQTLYGIANTVFQELAKQLEQAKIQVKKDTPVFTIVEPASVPSESSKPNRLMISVIWVFLGGIAGLGWIFGKHFLVEIRKKWADTV